MVERLRMAGEGNNLPEGSSEIKGPEGTIAVVEKLSDQPDVVIADEGTQSKSPGFWRKITGRETKPLVLDQQPHVTEILNPEEQPGNAQGITNEAEQSQEAEEEQAEQAGTNGPPPPDDGEPGEPRGPEGPRGPLPPDYLWSPEYQAERWSVAKELVRLESLPYKEKYDGGKNEQNLYRLYREWKRLEGLDNSKSYSRKPFDSKDLEEPTQADQQPSYEEQDLTNLPAVRDLFTNYNELLDNPNAIPEQIDTAREQLSSFFKEAKRGGLLEGVDTALKSVAKEIQHGLDQGLSPDEIMMGIQESYSLGIEGRSGVLRRIEAILSMGERTFRVARRANPEIAKLEGVWEPYIQLAVERLTLPFNPRLTPPLPIEGEFTFEAEREEALRRLMEEEEIYWRPTYANYFTVYARTPEQFDRAQETFIRWMRTALGKSPEELLQKVNGFKEALTSAGQRAGSEIQQYTVELRRELEALMGVIGANFSNEFYNANYFKQFWSFVAQYEGPARMLRLARTSQGLLAAALQKFDKDPRLELLFSPHGSRGQLMGRQRNAIEMEGLQEQILTQLTAEVMGIAMKGYHPDDPEKRLGDRMYEGNLAEITKFKSDEDFKNLYEGFDLEEQERFYKELSTKQASDLRPAEKLALERLERARKIQQYLEAGRDPGKLEGADRVMYEEARNAVTLAYELYGAMGEKAKRGGGVFLVDRRGPEGKFRDYIPNNSAEKFVHFAENWTKATYGHLLAAELKYRVDQARRMAIWALKTYGFEARLWDFTLLRGGKPVDPNTLGYHPSYGVNRNTTNPIEKYRYAVPNNPRILGYNSRGEEVILVFDTEGKPVGLEFDQAGKAVIYDKAYGDDRNRIAFDNLDRNTKAEPMLLKRPKEEDDPQKPGRKRVVRKADGSTVVDGEDEKGVSVTFDIATHHIYSRWTGHPYWGYQEEDTGLLLTQESFDGAKAIKEGKLRWQDVPPHAVQLLIVDPTLERVGHFDLESLETLITLAAGEESYQGHWRVGDELYMNFFSADASRLKNRTAYVLQDHGGSTKEWFHARAQAALWPDGKVRRLRTFTPFIPLRFASMSEMWGAPGGALDVFRMMGYEKYRMVGQFAMDKWINQTGAAQAGYEAIFDWFSEQEMKLQEGLGRKLNNEADRLRVFYKQYSDGKLGNRSGIATVDEDTDEEFLKLFRDTLKRPEVVMNRNTVLQSVFRGERAPLWLEGIEIFKRRPDGTYELDEDNNKILNEAIDWNRDSGSSRHDNKIFLWRYVRLLRSDQPREGQDLYPAEAQYYELGDLYTLASMRLAKAAQEAGDPNWERFLETRFEWFEGKANN